MSTRFMRRGVSKILFSPTIANINSVQQSELTGATDLTASVATINGFALSNTPIPVPDMGSVFEKSIPGPDAAANSSLDFYEDQVTNVIETLLPKGTTGYVLLLRKGNVPGSKSLDVFPIRVSTKAPQYSAGNDPAKFSTQFTITDVPALDTMVPFAAIGALTTALVTASPTTALAVPALTAAIAAGAQVTVTSGTHTDTFTVATGGAAINAASIPVTSQTATFAYPIGSTVVEIS